MFTSRMGRNDDLALNGLDALANRSIAPSRNLVDPVDTYLWALAVLRR